MESRGLPDARGYFEAFGGRFVPETVITALEELERAYRDAQGDSSFQARLDDCLRQYAGRPTPLYRADNLTRLWGGASVYLKREDLCHTGAHKINNTLGQALLTMHMGKKRVIAETGAGQHGVATATVAALFGLECEIYMGEEDIRRQSLNVFKMKLLGGVVIPVSSGSRTLKDAVNEAMRDWVTNIETTHYILGSVVGPHPYPLMVRDFQAVIGRETIEQMNHAEGKLPDCCLACVGGGSNAMGMFHPFLSHEEVKLIGVEAAGYGLDTDKHAAPLAVGTPGVLHGSMSYLMQDENGLITVPHSVSAGLDYPGVGPEHSYLKASGRVEYTSASDREALEAFKLLAEQEGIIPALEPAHALARAPEIAAELGEGKILVICLSGRGDKDMGIIAEEMGVSL